MNIYATLKVALRALARNKMRSVLTSLGIIIAVAALIAMVSIGQGASATVQEQIAKLGNNILYVQAGSSRTGGMHSGFGSITTLIPEDVDAIETECPAVAAASPG
ncbi:MAG: ABC transporter permease, partial [Blastocatellia bacterium]